VIIQGELTDFCPMRPSEQAPAIIKEHPRLRGMAALKAGQAGAISREGA
jgi:hypothetical protein